MKTSLFTAMGLFALVGLGLTNPVAQGRPESFNNEEVEQPPRRGGRGDLERSRLNARPQRKQQEPLVFYCMAGIQGDIGQICDQCQGTPVENDPTCAPAQRGCKVKDKSCFTDQKCQQEYGQQAKAQQCGKQQENSFQNNQLLSTNEQQQPRPGGEEGDSMEG